MQPVRGKVDSHESQRIREGKKVKEDKPIKNLYVTIKELILLKMDSGLKFSIWWWWGKQGSLFYNGRWA